MSPICTSKGKTFAFHYVYIIEKKTFVEAYSKCLQGLALVPLNSVARKAASLSCLYRLIHICPIGFRSGLHQSFSTICAHVWNRHWLKNWLLKPCSIWVLVNRDHRGFIVLCYSRQYYNSATTTLVPSQMRHFNVNVPSIWSPQIEYRMLWTQFTTCTPQITSCES